jgi:Raf kinase inhibitor-like YbhB/YbcL family protein
MRAILAVLVVAAFVCAVAGCGQGPRSPQGERARTAETEGAQAPEGGAVAAPGAGEGSVATIELSSSAFGDGGAIPLKYTCDGANVSPPLAWGEPPAGTKSLALIVEDPDAVAVAKKVWDHWVLYDLSAETTSLPEGIPAGAELANGARQGRGSSGIGYRGPCPPRAMPHHYHFKLYALDAPTGLGPGATKDQVLAAITGHVLGQGELVGIYVRK